VSLICKSTYKRITKIHRPHVSYLCTMSLTLENQIATKCFGMNDGTDARTFSTGSFSQVPPVSPVESSTALARLGTVANRHTGTSCR
jgi:hypothetical protein